MARRSPSDPQCLDELLALLRDESAKRRSNQRWTTGLFITLMVTYLSIVIVLWIARHEFPSDVASHFTTFSTLIGAGAAMSATHKRALALAKENPDPRLTGFFLEALEAEEKDVRTLAYESLILRLGSLTRDEYHGLEEHQRAAFGRSLASLSNVAYLRVAIDAAGRCAGAEAIRRLEDVAEHALPRKNPSEFEKARTAARLALADIRMRLAKETIEQKEAETEEIRSRVSLELPSDLHNVAG